MSIRKPKTGDELLAPSQYVAKVRLSGPDNETLAEPGQTCDKVPAASLGWLVKQKLVERQGKARAEEEAG